MKYYYREYALIPTIRITRNAIPFIDELHTYIDILWLKYCFTIYKKEKPLKNE